MLDLEGYLAGWSVLHGNAAPTGVVGRWLRLTHRAAAPLARRRVPPDAVTAAGTLLGLGCLVPAAAGGRWLLVAALLVGVSGVLDGLDGAVAVISRRATRWGYVLDSACDRLVDAGHVTALWLAGAPGPLCVAAAVLGALHEYVRARAGAAGMSDVGVVSVSERPTRIIVAGLTLASAGLVPAHADVTAAAGTGAAVGLAAVGLGQVVAAVRRALAGTAAGSGRSDESGDDAGGQRDERQAAAGMRRPPDQVQPGDG